MSFVTALSSNFCFCDLSSNKIQLAHYDPIASPMQTEWLEFCWWKQLGLNHFEAAVYCKNDLFPLYRLFFPRQPIVFNSINSCSLDWLAELFIRVSVSRVLCKWRHLRKFPNDDCENTIRASTPSLLDQFIVEVNGETVHQQPRPAYYREQRRHSLVSCHDVGAFAVHLR